MAIPSDPTLTEIVTEGLKRGGKVNPTAAQITDAKTHQIQEVKADIRLAQVQHPFLLTTAVTATTKGVSRYSWPTDADKIRSVTLLDGPDAWRGTAQSGGSNTITLAADFSEDADEVIGKFLAITGGTGSNQMDQVTAYNNSTKQATVESSWSTQPDGTSTYLLVNDHLQLWNEDKQFGWDLRRLPTDLGRPDAAAMFAQTLYLNFAPDKIYVLWWDYYADIDRLNETGPLFVKLLREWRSLWIQGVAAYTAQRFDDDRFDKEWSIYQSMLKNDLGAMSAVVSQVQYRDL